MNNLFLYGPELPGMVVAIATRADQAWLVAADQRVTPGLVVRLTLARSRQTIIVAATRLGGARSPASSRAAADASSAPHPATWRLRPPAPRRRRPRAEHSWRPQPGAQGFLRDE